MKNGDEILVYGTLRDGERASLKKSAKQFCVDFLGKDTINGKLYHLGAYPGLKLISGSHGDDFTLSLPTVVGEVFHICDPSIVSVLDMYEGYNPDNPSLGLYDRKEVFTALGRLVWVYVFNGLVTEDQLIETGDWKNPRLSASRSIPTLTIGRRTK